MTTSASGIYQEAVRGQRFRDFGDQRTVAPFSNSACNLVIESIFTSTSIGNEDERGILEECWDLPLALHC
jgi:hypothetical protein